MGRPGLARRAPEWRDPRAAVVVGLVTAGLMAVCMGLIIHTAGIHNMALGDGRLFVRVAMHPLRPIAPGDDTYRHGRILFPALGWLLALGRPGLIPWGLVAANVMAAALLAGATSALVIAGGGDGRAGFVVLLLPVVWAVVRFSYSDVVAASLVVLGCAAWRTRKLPLAWLAFALAALARETMLIAVVPPILESLHRREIGRALGWMTTATPLVLWWVYVRSQSGEWPPLARDPHRDRAIAPPFLGVVRAWGHGGYRVSLGIALVTVLAAAATAAFLRSDNPALAHALAFSAFTVFLGPEVWMFWGETWRLLLVAQVFILAGVATAATRRRPLGAERTRVNGRSTPVMRH